MALRDTLPGVGSGSEVSICDGFRAGQRADAGSHPCSVKANMRRDFPLFTGFPLSRE